MPAHQKPPSLEHVCPPLARSAAEVRQALGAAGCRFTSQRGAVYSHLEQTREHPTADDVYQAVRQGIPHISLATVYKSLEALVAAGLANKLSTAGGPARYDCRGAQHYHLCDEQTGEVRDLPLEFDPTLLEKLQPRLVEQLSREGFEVTGYRLEVLGRFAK